MKSRRRTQPSAVRLKATSVFKAYQIRAAMSALGHKQTYAAHKRMSAFPPIATLIAHFGMSAMGQKRTLDTPEVLKSRRRQLSGAHGVLNVAVAEVSLQRPCVGAFVGQRVAAGMPQHVRVRLECELGLDRCPFHHAGEPGSAERCPALRGEHEGRLGLLLTLEPS